MENDKILIVDDNPQIRRDLSHLISLQGYSCDTADSRETAMGMLGKVSYKLAIIDLRLSDDLDMRESKEEGIEIINWLENAHSQTRVLVCTGYATSDTAVQLAGLSVVVGMFDKPVRFKRFFARIKEIMESQSPTSFSEKEIPNGSSPLY